MPIFRQAYEAVAAAAAATGALVDGGKVTIYDGAMPANPGVAVTTQNTLVEFTLKTPAFGAPTAGTNRAVITLDNPDPEPAVANGTAAWARVEDSSGDAIWDADVTDTSGTGALKISSTNVVSGIDVSIVSLVYAQPQW